MATKFLNKRRRESLLSTVWGGMWGVVVGGVIVTLASQLAVRHDLVLPRPEARTVETPSGTEFDQARPETDPEVPSEETVPAADVAAVSPAQPGPADTSPQFDTTPAAAPETRFDGPAAPDRPNVPQGAEVALTTREGLRPETAGAPEAAAPLPPTVERRVAVARDVPAPPVPAPAADPAESAPQTTAPAQPDAAPETETAEVAPVVEPTLPEVVAEAAPAQPEATPDPAPLAEATPAEAPDLASAEPEIPAAPEAETANAAPVAVVEADPAGEAPSAPVVETPGAAPAVLAEPAAPDAPQEEPVGVEVADLGTAPVVRQPVAPSVPAAGAAVPETPRIVRETPSLIQTSEPQRISTDNAASAVPAPSVGAPATRLGTSEAGVEAAPEPTPAPEGGALIANRAPFEADPDLGQLAVILTHDGEGLPDAASLADLPAEVSFAVDARLTAAADIAAAYRAAGREVVLIPAFPPRAAPQDIEVALSANMTAIPGAVAVMDPGSAGFQSDRAAVGQVIAVLAESGHGLITAARGLNTAQQIADRFEVPAALIFNDLGTLDDAAAAARALDRVAFRARQEEGIIVLGQGDANTRAGLIEWLQGRAAGGLQLAPVSAVMAPMSGVEDAAEEAEAPSSGLPQVRRLPQIQTQSN